MKTVGDGSSDVIANDLVYPEQYFLPMGRLEPIRLVGVKGRIDPALFTEAKCYVANYLMVALVPGERD